MRFNVTGPKAVVGSLESALKADNVVSTERVDGQLDRTEQAFGIGEVATVVAILTGVGKLVEYLVIIAKALKKGERQTLRIKSALGMVIIELDPDVTAETLARHLSALEAAR